MDEYHNILSEEFPSPVREHEPLPPTTDTPTHDEEQTIHSTLEQIVEEHVAGSSLDAQDGLEGEDLLNTEADSSTIYGPQELIPPSTIDLGPSEATTATINGHVEQGEQTTPGEHAEVQPTETSTNPHDDGMDSRQDVEGETLPPMRDGSDGPIEKMELDDPTDRRKGGVKYQTLTEKEKKERQKLQNRRAAEKSRAKKRDELSQLEIDVNGYTEENARLRARLAELQANQLPGVDNDQTASSSKAPETNDDHLGVDYSYLGKIQSELIIAKTKLYEREVECLKLRGIELSAANEPLRQMVANHNTTVFGLQAEVTSLEGLVEGLEKERLRVVKETKDVRRELDRRRLAGGREVEVVDQPEPVPLDPALVDGGSAMEVDEPEVPPGYPGQAERVDIVRDAELERTTATPTPAASTPPIRTSGIGVGSGVPSSGLGVGSGLGAEGGAGVDKSLMDIGGWVDAAVRDWHEDLPVPREADIPMERDRSIGHDSLTSA